MSDAWTWFATQPSQTQALIYLMTILGWLVSCIITSTIWNERIEEADENWVSDEGSHIALFIFAPFYWAYWILRFASWPLRHVAKTIRAKQEKTAEVHPKMAGFLDSLAKLEATVKETTKLNAAMYEKRHPMNQEGNIALITMLLNKFEAKEKEEKTNKTDVKPAYGSKLNPEDQLLTLGQARELLKQTHPTNEHIPDSRPVINPIEGDIVSDWQGRRRKVTFVNLDTDIDHQIRYSILERDSDQTCSSCTMSLQTWRALYEHGAIIEKRGPHRFWKGWPG